MPNHEFPYHANLPRALINAVPTLVIAYYFLTFDHDGESASLLSVLMGEVPDQSIYSADGAFSVFVVSVLLYISITSWGQFLYSLLAHRSIKLMSDRMIVPKISIWGKDKVIFYRDIAGVQGLINTTAVSIYGVPIPVFKTKNYFISTLKFTAKIKAGYIDKSDAQRLARFLSAVKLENDVFAFSYHIGFGFTKILAIIGGMASLFALGMFLDLDQNLSSGKFVPLPDLLMSLVGVSVIWGISSVAFIEYFRVNFAPFFQMLKFDGSEFKVPSLFYIFGQKTISARSLHSVEERGFFFKRLVISSKNGNASIYRFAVGNDGYEVTKAFMHGKGYRTSRSLDYDRLAGGRKVR